ncbi:MAG: hypothetical protein DHS20C15_13100 [Planctomycetota bacterium]|nr:MAG: hypothetical protein DHS20C15_13100 [Planctomycetota bacterium]
MKCASVSTTNPDAAAALDGLLNRLLDALDGERPDLLVAFFTSHHSEDAALIRERILGLADPKVLLGCPAASVISDEAELEGQAGITLWGAVFPGAKLQPFQLGVDDGSEAPKLEGFPEEVPTEAGFLVLVDPYSTPANDLVGGFASRYPGQVLTGGFASGAPGPGQAQLLCNDGVLDEGTVGVVVSGAVQLDTIVSQGCRPVGHHFVITKADRNLIHALGGKPVLEQLQTVANEVDNVDRGLIQTALHVGRVVDERKSNYERGDFLVRNVLGIDPKKSALAINDYVKPGQTIQFMVRDARAASEELEELSAAQGKKAGATYGALLFSCNGRGTRFFGKPNHDIEGLHKGLGDAPAAGFHCAGEIGPVGGVPFVHGFTASIAVFKERADGMGLPG